MTRVIIEWAAHYLVSVWDPATDCGGIQSLLAVVGVDSDNAMCTIYRQG
jgi:hypothetical protein